MVSNQSLRASTYWIDCADRHAAAKNPRMIACFRIAICNYACFGSIGNSSRIRAASGCAPYSQISNAS